VYTQEFAGLGEGTESPLRNAALQLLVYKRSPDSCMLQLPLEILVTEMIKSRNYLLQLEVLPLRNSRRVQLAPLGSKSQQLVEETLLLRRREDHLFFE
jgi:hypothetical protein